MYNCTGSCRFVVVGCKAERLCRDGVVSSQVIKGVGLLVMERGGVGGRPC